MVHAGDDLSGLDTAGFKPTQKRVSAQVIEGFRAGIRSGSAFWANSLYVGDPIEVSPSGAIKDGHHRLAAILLEGLSPNSLPEGTIRIVLEENILYPVRIWGKVVVDL